MFIDSYILIQTVSLAIFLFILEIGYLLVNKKRLEKEALEKAMNNNQKVTRGLLLKNKIKKLSIYQRYYQWLSQQMDLAFEEKETPDSVIHNQVLLTSFGIAMVVVLSFILPIAISSLVGFLCLLIVFFLAYHYKNIVDKKNRQFDMLLPRFINQTIMVLKIGISMENAFGYGLQSMDEGLARKEFEKVVAELSILPDDIPRIFMNLSQRVKTEECERFCSIIVSGLKNGNRMSSILESEYKRIADNEVAQMKKESEKKKTWATIINILLIFVPVGLLLVLPLMNIGEML